MDSKVLILGSGAMACLFASRLAQAGIHIRMLATWALGLQALQTRGVCLEQDGVRTCSVVQASAELSDCMGAEMALVLVKSWQTARAAWQLAQVLAPGGVAMTLQNGLGAREILVDHIGEQRAAAGVTTLGATLIEPGCVRPTAAGEVILGAHPRIDPLLETLQQAGLPCRVEPDVESLLWGKLVINAAINPLTALLRVPNGALLETPQARVLVEALAGEAESVAKAAGIRLPYPDTLAQVETVLRQTAGNQSSMLQDVLRGAPTEIDAITGALLEQAHRLGVPVPVNEKIYHMVRTQKLASR